MLAPVSNADPTTIPCTTPASSTTNLPLPTFTKNVNTPLTRQISTDTSIIRNACQKYEKVIKEFEDFYLSKENDQVLTKTEYAEYAKFFPSPPYLRTGRGCHACFRRFLHRDFKSAVQMLLSKDASEEIKKELAMLVLIHNTHTYFDNALYRPQLWNSLPRIYAVQEFFGGEKPCTDFIQYMLLKEYVSLKIQENLLHITLDISRLFNARSELEEKTLGTTFVNIIGEMIQTLLNKPAELANQGKLTTALCGVKLNLHCPKNQISTSTIRFLLPFLKESKTLVSIDFSMLKPSPNDDVYFLDLVNHLPHLHEFFYEPNHKNSPLQNRELKPLLTHEQFLELAPGKTTSSTYSIISNLYLGVMTKIGF